MNAQYSGTVGCQSHCSLSLPQDKEDYFRDLYGFIDDAKDRYFSEQATSALVLIENIIDESLDDDLNTCYNSTTGLLYLDEDCAEYVLYAEAWEGDNDLYDDMFRLLYDHLPHEQFDSLEMKNSIHSSMDMKNCWRNTKMRPSLNLRPFGMFLKVAEKKN